MRSRVCFSRQGLAGSRGRAVCCCCCEVSTGSTCVHGAEVTDFNSPQPQGWRYIDRRARDEMQRSLGDAHQLPAPCQCWSKSLHPASVLITCLTAMAAGQLRSHTHPACVRGLLAVNEAHLRHQTLPAAQQLRHGGANQHLRGWGGRGGYWRGVSATLGRAPAPLAALPPPAPAAAPAAAAAVHGSAISSKHRHNAGLPRGNSFLFPALRTYVEPACSAAIARCAFT